MEVDRLTIALIIGIGLAAGIAFMILALQGIYVFFFFLPVTFGIPWAVRKIIMKNKKRQDWRKELQ